VRNAIKYMGDAPVRRVTVRSFARRRAVRIEVADTGPGLPPEAASRVFEPYVRATATSGGGFGLGLATVRRLVEAHRGRVGVDSGPTGATFWVELPSA
jgi:signal transduction histidine kinase